jgi:hypothetical protein
VPAFGWKNNARENRGGRARADGRRRGKQWPGARALKLSGKRIALGQHSGKSPRRPTNGNGRPPKGQSLGQGRLRKTADPALRGQSLRHMTEENGSILVLLFFVRTAKTRGGGGIQTKLHEWHVRAGARMGDFNG